MGLGMGTSWTRVVPGAKGHCQKSLHRRRGLGIAAVEPMSESSMNGNDYHIFVRSMGPSYSRDGELCIGTIIELGRVDVEPCMYNIQ